MTKGRLPPTSQIAAELPRVSAWLVAVRRRLVIGRVGTALFWLLSLIVLVAALAALLSGVGYYISHNRGAVILALLVLGATVVGVVVAKTPGPVAIARQSDSHFHLGERVSTALELVARSGGEGALRQALLQDAEAMMDRVDARAIAPIWRKGSVAGVIALGLSVGLYALSVTIASPHTEETVLAEPAQVATPEVLAADIEALAELLAEDAAENQYLSAIAKSLEQLSQEAASGLDAALVEQRLSALTEHARLAYGSEPPAWLQQVSDLAGLSQMLDARQQAANTASATNLQVGSLDDSGERTAQDMVDFPLPPPMPIGVPPFSEGVGGGAQGGIDQLAEGGAISAQPMPDLGQLGEKLLQQQPMAGAPMGASSDAGRGEGDLAGSGSQPMAPDAAFASHDFESGDNVMLPNQPENTGSRIRIQMPTDTRATDVAEGGFGENGAGEALTETPIQRDFTLREQQHTIGRYFARGL